MSGVSEEEFKEKKKAVTSVLHFTEYLGKDIHFWLSTVHCYVSVKLALVLAPVQNIYAGSNHDNPSLSCLIFSVNSTVDSTVWLLSYKLL